MTTRSSTSSDATTARPVASFAELGERLRKSIVSVRAGALCSTGVALGSGLVVTSHDAARYLPVVTLRRDDGTQVDGRVIHCDVGADLALVWPIDRFEMPPLRRSSRGALLGQSVAAISRLGEGPLRLEPGFVTETERTERGRAFVATQGTAPLSGAPLVDADGRILGLFGRRRGEGLATPLAIIERFFTEAQRGGGLSERVPAYRCPTCDETYAAERSRCGGCGHALPYAEACTEGAASEDRIAEALAPIGAAPANLRVGPRRYRALAGVEDAPEIAKRVVELALDAETSRWTIRTIVLATPPTASEALYRLLLTMNDETTGPCALGIVADDLVLSCAVSSASPRQLGVHLSELLRRADHYERVLTAQYGAKA